MIISTDTKLSAAIKSLRNNIELGPKMLEMDQAGVKVNVQPGPQFPTSRTRIQSAREYDIFINTAGDDAAAKKKWGGVTGTKEENSIAHELGHVWFSYQKMVRNKQFPSGPKTVTPELWEEILEEAIARRFDNYSGPPGVIVPTADTYAEPENILAAEIRFGNKI